ncbi:MAG: class I SAM-dependent methyltransferase [Candidatus Zambryskibacteria bacterium]|nr:class I SAM-dependent methyltransferase [Candidatus Zambryskibacteria bacterium]
MNAFVKENEINSVIEFGSGDGNQLSLFEFKKYIGLDVSLTAVEMCKERFKNDNTKNFFLYDSSQFSDRDPVFKADLALSLDVIYHIIEDKIFDKYMRHLFSSANKFVIIYSSDRDDNKNDAPHYKNRNFSTCIDNNLKDWKLIKKIPNKYPDESSSDFFIFQKL